MVSFSCEACNEVLPKKRLDAHTNRCWNAAFTCLDCMQTFVGTDYRLHTSCISEAQKYHGAKQQPSRTRQSRPDSQYGRHAYVEDAPDQDSGTVVIVDAPPHAPSPPPPPAGPAAIAPGSHQQDPGQQQTPGPPINVFDFLVNEDTPNASRLNVALPEMKMNDAVEVREVTIAPAPGAHLHAIVDRNDSRETFGESRYAETGFHYGDGPVPATTAMERAHAESYMTPAPHQDVERVRVRTKDRKRKRVQVEELHIPANRMAAQRGEGDEMMIDAPPLLHSGLTGGLKSLLSSSRPSEYPPSPEWSSGGAGGRDEPGGPSPGSPLKRSKRHSVTRNPTTALVPARRQTSHHGGAGTTHDVTEVHHHSHRLSRHHRRRRGHEHESGSRHERHRRRERERERSRDRDIGDLSDRRSPPTSPHAGTSAPARKLKVIKYRSVSAEDRHNDSGSRDRRSDSRRPHHHHHNHRHHQSGANHSQQQQQQQQLVVYRSSAEQFLSFVTKGPESEKGCSINKVLKRYHRERGTAGSLLPLTFPSNGNGNGNGNGAGSVGSNGSNNNNNNNNNGAGGGVATAKTEEEKELWKSLRLRRNDRGEIILFAAGTTTTTTTTTAAHKTTTTTTETAHAGRNSMNTGVGLGVGLSSALVTTSASTSNRVSVDRDGERHRDRGRDRDRDRGER